MGLALLCFFYAAGRGYAEYPKPTNSYINDYAHVLDDATSRALAAKFALLEKKTAIEMVVVIVNSSNDYVYSWVSWEVFATGWFNSWGIGNRPRNDGILILISKNERKIRIELGTGYPQYQNYVMKHILNSKFAPYLECDDYKQALNEGSDEIIRAVTNPYLYLKWYIFIGSVLIMSTILAIYSRVTGKSGTKWFCLTICGVLIIGIIELLIGVLLKYGSSRGGSGFGGGGFGGGRSSGGGASGSF
jgi:uncharacterized protein